MRLLLALTVAAGCGHRATPPHPEPVASGRDAVVAEAGPTDEECDALIAHAIDLQTPGDAGIGSADRTTLSGEVRDRVLKRCRAMPLATYRCAIAAATTVAFTGCDQARPSSSTSNSSVAPPGMSPPPTPRAP